MTDPTGIVASSWVTRDPEYKDRQLWWRSLWIAWLTKLRTGRQIRRGELIGTTIRADSDSCSWSTKYAHQIYLQAGGDFVQYIPRRQRKRVK